MEHIGRIKVIDKIADDIMDTVCICPHCGSHALYGNMFTVSGIHGCTKCQEELNDAIYYDKEHYYEVYITKANNFEYEPYRYIKEFE
jgi:uncharacterized protein (DUF983 family)